MFDKTGTLTEGKPKVTDEMQFIGATEGDALAARMGGDYVLFLAALAEQHSGHPLATAIVQEASKRCLVIPMQPEGAYSEELGRGVSCESPEFGLIRVGNRANMQSAGIDIGVSEDATLNDLEVRGKTAVCISRNHRIVGVLGIADSVKPDAAEALMALRGMGVDVWMVTGDHRTTAESVAEELGLPRDRIVASAMPGDKVTKVRELQDLRRVVAVVGDGINDSPALAQADLGIAVGAGSHIATEAADMVLIRNQLADVYMALHLARVVFHRIKINFVWASIYNVVAIPFAAGIWYPWTRMFIPPQYAALAMALSSVSVVVSSMLLRLYKRPAPKDVADREEAEFRSKKSKHRRAQLKPMGISRVGDSIRSTAVAVKQSLQQPFGSPSSGKAAAIELSPMLSKSSSNNIGSSPMGGDRKGGSESHKVPDYNYDQLPETDEFDNLL